MPDTALQLLITDPRQSVLMHLGGGACVAFTPFGYAPPTYRAVGYGGFHAEADGLFLLGNGYRAYRPSLLRFTRPDAFSPFKAGGVNCYAYCAGDPVNRYDPGGMFPLWLSKMAEHVDLIRWRAAQAVQRRTGKAIGLDQVALVVPNRPPIAMRQGSPERLIVNSARVPNGRQVGPLAQSPSSSADPAHVRRINDTASALTAGVENPAARVEILRGVLSQRDPLSSTEAAAERARVRVIDYGYF